jgi:mono/diheme cytochrome c family protein
MRKILAFSLVGVFLGILLSGGLSRVSAQEGQGKGIYDDKCALCHGRDGKGNGPAAASLSPGPPDFTNPAFRQRISNAQIKETIENGHGSMPAVNLSSDQIKAVIVYLNRAFK